MPRRSKADYPPDWPQIAAEVKADAGNACIRCEHPHDPPAGYTLTVHHLDLNPANNRWWNLAALCQRCHLRIQAKVVMNRPWLFEHSDWFKPYVAGYYAFHAGLPDDKAHVLEHVDELIAMGQGRPIKERELA